MKPARSVPFPRAARRRAAPCAGRSSGETPDDAAGGGRATRPWLASTFPVIAHQHRVRVLRGAVLADLLIHGEVDVLVGVALRLGRDVAPLLQSILETNRLRLRVDARRTKRPLAWSEGRAATARSDARFGERTRARSAEGRSRGRRRRADAPRRPPLVLLGVRRRGSCASPAARRFDARAFDPPSAQRRRESTLATRARAARVPRVSSGPARVSLRDARRRCAPGARSARRRGEAGRGTHLPLQRWCGSRQRDAAPRAELEVRGSGRGRRDVPLRSGRRITAEGTAPPSAGGADPAEGRRASLCADGGGRRDRRRLPLRQRRGRQREARLASARTARIAEGRAPVPLRNGGGPAEGGAPRSARTVRTGRERCAVPLRGR